jgi:glycine/D-amino acid oxidase-like deaminating enzyme
VKRHAITFDTPRKHPVGHASMQMHSSPDGLPTIGQLPDVANGWLATGHYRAGLHLSTGTAVAIADLICGDSPQQPLDAFSPQRHQTALGIGSHC